MLTQLKNVHPRGTHPMPSDNNHGRPICEGASNSRGISPDSGRDCVAQRPLDLPVAGRSLNSSLEIGSRNKDVLMIHIEFIGSSVEHANKFDEVVFLPVERAHCNPARLRVPSFYLEMACDSHYATREAQLPAEPASRPPTWAPSSCQFLSHSCERRPAQPLRNRLHFTSSHTHTLSCQLNCFHFRPLDGIGGLAWRILR